MLLLLMGLAFGDDAASRLRLRELLGYMKIIYTIPTIPIVSIVFSTISQYNPNILQWFPFSFPLSQYKPNIVPISPI